MATSSTNTVRKPWTAIDVKQLRLLVKLKRPTSEIAAALGRTPPAVTSKVVSLGLSLKPKAKARAANKSTRSSKKSSSKKKK